MYFEYMEESSKKKEKKKGISGIHEMKDKEKHDKLNSFDTGMGTLTMGKEDDTDKLTDSIFNLAKGQQNEMPKKDTEKNENKKTFFQGEGKKLGVTDVKVIDEEKKDNIKPIYKKEKKEEPV
jgi:hypothetical protein